VVDPVGASIAKVRVMLDVGGATIYRTSSDDQGMFHLEGVRPGIYTISVRATGFRPKTVAGVVVAEDKPTQLDMTLFVLSCEAPGVHCFCIGPDCHKGALGKRAFLTMGVSCMVDLDADTPSCSPKELKGADLALVAGDVGTLYLSPLEGSFLSYESNCLEKPTGTERVRINGTGKNDDFCVGTTEGRISHIFLTKDVEPGEQSVTIWFVNDR
jgi:hypothetical protein